MKQYLAPESHIHILARALIVQDENLVLCQVKGKKWFFLPGGHVEDGEPATAALTRELHEELGLTDFSKPVFVGVCEHQFEDKPDVWQHELSLVFTVTVGSDFKVDTKESHIDFVTVKKSELPNLEVRPSPLKAGLIESLNTGTPFLKEFPVSE